MILISLIPIIKLLNFTNNNNFITTNDINKFNNNIDNNKFY